MALTAHAVQGKAAKLLMYASSSAEAISMLEALEHGVHGIILETGSPSQVTCAGCSRPSCTAKHGADSMLGRTQVRALVKYLDERATGSMQLQYSVARVVRVEPVGPGDRRVCGTPRQFST